MTDPDVGIATLMPTAAARSAQPARTLHLALDLGNRTWKLAFATGVAPVPRLRTMPARELAQLDAEIAAAKATAYADRVRRKSSQPPAECTGEAVPHAPPPRPTAARVW